MTATGQWLFWQQKEAIKNLIDQQAPTLAVVNSLSGNSRITVIDPLSGSVRPGTLQVFGTMPVVGERILLLTLSDGEQIATRLSTPVPPVGFPSAHMQAGRALFLSTVQPLGTLSGVTLTANRLYYVPIYVPKTFSAVSLLFEVTTVVSGEVQMALYDSLDTMIPGARVANGSRVTYGALGVKTQTITTMTLYGGRWYWVGLCSKVAMAIRGSTVAANLPSLRGGSSTDLASIFLLAFEDITAGWTDLPANAAAGSGPSNTYLHLGVGS